MIFTRIKSKNWKKKLPATQCDPLKTLKSALLRWGEKSKNLKKMKIQTVGISHTKNLLRKLGNSTSYGLDGLDSISLKMVSDEIAAPLNFIVNLSIRKSTFANKWKVGRIVPIHKGKGKDVSLPESYRPVSLLPAVSKVVEKTVQEQICQHMKTEKLWNDNHHAYKMHYSTTTALSQLTDTLYEAADDKQISIAMTIDESAAFDVIHHSMLLEKLALYNYDSTTIAWISNYLNFRSQYVTIGCHDSKINSVKCGVPQGSTLGPTLFNIFTNELPDIVNEYDTCKNVVHKPSEYLFGQNCKECGSLPCYADDALYTVASTSRSWNQKRLEIIFNRLSTFLNSNRLSINKSKTTLQEMMLVQRKCKQKGEPPHLDVITDKGDNKRVKVKTQNIFLGATLQENLKWSGHIENGEEPMLSSLRKKLGSLKFMSKYLPQKTKLILANGLILSKILYILPIYGGTYEKYLSKIQIIMNKTIRFVLNKSRRTKSSELMTAVGWLDIYELSKFHSLLLMWRIVRLNSPRYFENKIKIEKDNRLSTSTPRIQNTESGFRWRTVISWNEMSPELRQELSYPRFKRNLRKWILKCRPPKNVV